jgi:hypothetical protein
MTVSESVIQSVKCPNCGQIYEVPVRVELGYGGGRDVILECRPCEKTFPVILVGPRVTPTTSRI